MRTDYNAHDFIEVFIINGIQEIVKAYPYQSFPLMASAIEVLGKCITGNSWDAKVGSEKDFCEAINTLNAFQPYRVFNHVKLDKNGNSIMEGNNQVITNDLYRILRCGMIHSFIPKTGIKLTDKTEDLKTGIIGGQEMYSRIKCAWTEINASPNMIKQDFQSPNMFTVDNSLSGNTSTFITVIE